VDEVDLIRAEKILQEFGITGAVLRGNGMEFKRISGLSGDYPLIVPLNFPKAPGVASVAEQESVDLRDLMEWEHAPSNVRFLLDHGLEIALTTDGNPDEFTRNLSKTAARGVSPEQLLSLTTTIPAKLLGIGDEAGMVRPGFRANLVVADAPLFTEKGSGGILFTWVDGRPYRIAEETPADIKGHWDITGDFGFDDPVRLEISSGKSAVLRIGSTTAEVSHFTMDSGNVHFVSRHSAFGDEPLVIFSGALVSPVEGSASVMSGRMVQLDGSGVNWTASFKADDDSDSAEKPDKGDTDNSEQKMAAAITGWEGFWDGRASVESENQDFSMSLFSRTDGDLYGHIRSDESIVPLYDIEVSDNQFKATAYPQRSYVNLYLRPVEDGKLEGWITGHADKEAGQLNIRATRLDEKKDSALTGRWAVKPQKTDESRHLKGEVTVSLMKTEGDWSATVLHQGMPVEVVQIWNAGTGKEADGLHLLLEAENPDQGGKATIALTLDNGSGLADGHAELPDGKKAHLTVSRVLPGARLAGKTSEDTGAAEKSEASDQADESPEHISPLALPFGPYSVEELPSREDVWVHDATVWTSGPDGTLAGADLLIYQGKVHFVGTPEQAEEKAGLLGDVEWRHIDASGMHVTPGLIDCHSHTGISRGINEVGQAVTAEVSIGDSTDPDDINWYRQLAGGLTTVNTLHGSANPIGGQNQINKLRWGVAKPDDMHFEGAMPGIKFALGENVKRNQGRYPNTRMGVETVFRERFQAAREYLTQWDRYRSGELSVQPRRDLELEVLGEILEGRRLIHCHSYRQDEILMLCRVAGEFGFTIGTFQHILEGYKVAEAIREHAIGGSAFSDWWAYKVEVQDAIPYAGAIMHKAGVLVSFNSDDSEMARRMHLEAAKAVKYGGLSEEEALKFVTLNPAKQLMIDDRVGSLEPGKDGDFVIWSEHPFSTATVCQSTWIEGREFFSIEKDLEHRKKIAAERKRLMAKIVGPGKDEKQESPSEDRPEAEELPEEQLRRSPFDFWADRILASHNIQLLRWGIDPEKSACGECGIRGHQLIQ
jgi:imidazolonepropionase-like amidohydrolase